LQKRPCGFRGAFFSNKLFVTLAQAEISMAKKPNYDFEKRQKEIAKKAKKEEKKKRKLEDGETSEQVIPTEG